MAQGVGESDCIGYKSSGEGRLWVGTEEQLEECVLSVGLGRWKVAPEMNGRVESRTGLGLVLGWSRRGEG